MSFFHQTTRRYRGNAKTNNHVHSKETVPKLYKNNKNSAKIGVKDTKQIDSDKTSVWRCYKVRVALLVGLLTVVSSSDKRAHLLPNDITLQQLKFLAVKFVYPVNDIKLGSFFLNDQLWQVIGAGPLRGRSAADPMIGNRRGPEVASESRARVDWEQALDVT